MTTRSCVCAIGGAALWFCFAAMAHATVIEGPIYDSSSKANLYVVPLGSWNDAESAAQGLGGNLMTIQSADENQFVVNDVLLDLSGSGGPNLSQLPLWIGLYDPTGAANNDPSNHAANFIWADGSNSPYLNWFPGQPDDFAPGEYYTTINWTYALSNSYPQGTWNDTPLNGTSSEFPGTTVGPYYGIAEVPVPEPSTVILLVCGGAALAVICGRRVAV